MMFSKFSDMIIKLIEPLMYYSISTALFHIKEEGLKILAWKVRYSSFKKYGVQEELTNLIRGFWPKLPLNR